MSATSVLFKEGFVKWLRTRGLLMILAVALIPPALTAAWVGTHDADVAVTGIEWTPNAPVEGENMTVRATVRNIYSTSVDAFDVIMRIGFYRMGEDGRAQWVDRHNETVRVTEGLQPDEARSVETTWPAEPGNWQVEVFADFFDHENKEVEKLNNHRWVQVQVAYAQVRPDIQRPGDDNTSNETGADAAVAVASVDWMPEQVFAGDNVTYTVTLRNDGPEDVDNATVTFQLYRLTATGETRRLMDEDTNVSLPVGATPTAEFTYRGIDRGLYALAVFLDAPVRSDATEDSDTAIIQQFEVQQRLVWQEPEERATAKDFYRNQVLLPLHFTLLVPLIGLFFAGGVLQDERQRGNLIYVLTRPVPRWSLPVSRFASGFLVALLAVLVGVFATFLIIMGTPQQAPGFLWWPLVFGVLVLFLYGSVFTFVGVVSDRPYLVGLLYVLGFESLVLAGRRILVNGEFLVQDWVLNFSLMHWVTTAFEGWDPNDPSLLPVGDEATRAFFVILGIGIVALVAAAVAATRRQFPE